MRVVSGRRFGVVAVVAVIGLCLAGCDDVAGGGGAVESPSPRITATGPPPGAGAVVLDPDATTAPTPELVEERTGLPAFAGEWRDERLTVDGALVGSVTWAVEHRSPEDWSVAAVEAFGQAPVSVGTTVAFLDGTWRSTRPGEPTAVDRSVAPVAINGWLQTRHLDWPLAAPLDGGLERWERGDDRLREVLVAHTASGVPVGYADVVGGRVVRRARMTSLEVRGEPVDLTALMDALPATYGTAAVLP